MSDPASPVVHEAIWAPMAAVGLVVARWAPEDTFAGMVCPFHAITSLPCLTCGGTRAMRALVQLDLPTAFAMNPLVALAGVAGALYILHALRVALTRRPWRLDPEGRGFRWARPVLVAAVVVNWAYLIAVGR